MKSSISILFVLLGTFYAQSQTLMANESKALITISIQDEEKNPVADETITLIAISNKKQYHLVSNAQGDAEVLLPIADGYQVNFKHEPDYYAINVPNEAYYSQGYSFFYTPEHYKNADEATIFFTLKNDKGQPISETIKLINRKTKEEFSFHSNASGYVEMKIPNNAEYSVDYEMAPDYERLTIPNHSNYQLNYEGLYNGSYDGAVYPSLSQALIQVQYMNLKNRPVFDEKITVRSIKTDSIYSGITNDQGLVYFHVPLGDSYAISATYYEDFTTQKIKAEPGHHQINVEFEYISSKKYLQLQADRERLRKERDEAFKAGKLNFSPHFQDTVVSAVFSRNKDWTNKLVTIDVTGSMAPFNTQVELWYQMNAATENQTQFVLFNDGDNMSNQAKIIGNTGGIYFCNNCTPEELSTKILIAKTKGSGGDGPENDIEALVKGIRPEHSEIILIADNYSAVRDMALLSQLNRPIRVVLCGALNRRPHVDYLTLAYATGGSIHTMEQDLVNLSLLIDGEKITIGNQVYMLKRGRFLLYE